MSKARAFDVGDKIWIEVEVELFIDGGQTAVYTAPSGNRERISIESDRIKKAVKAPEWVPPRMR
jgi:hypothetical protein